MTIGQNGRLKRRSSRSGDVLGRSDRQRDRERQVDIPRQRSVDGDFVSTRASRSPEGAHSAGAPSEMQRRAAGAAGAGKPATPQAAAPRSRRSGRSPAPRCLGRNWELGIGIGNSLQFQNS